MSALAIACRISGVAAPVAALPVALPELVTPPQISGVATEAALFGADQSDTWSYAGNPAVVLARDYRLFLDGALVAGPQAEPAILVPGGTEGLAFAYQMRVSLAGGVVSAWTTLATGVVQPALRLSQTADGEVEVDGASGEVTVTITSPAEYAGTHVFQSVDLVSGPVNLVPPVIVEDGTPAEGETLGILPGLWVYDPDTGGLGSPSYQWQVDTGGNGVFADVTGATATSYLLTGGEAGDGVRLVETLADNGGSRSASSVAVSVAASGPLLLDSFGVADGYALNDDVPTSSVNWNIYHNTSGDARALVTPLGIARLDTTVANKNIRLDYSGPIGADHLIEVEVADIARTNRADLALTVRNAGDGIDPMQNGVRAFFKHSTSELIVREFVNGSVTANSVTVTGIRLAPGDVVRLSAIGAGASVTLNGAIVATLSGLSVTGGKPNWGAYVFDVATDHVALQSVLVDML